MNPYFPGNSRIKFLKEQFRKSIAPLIVLSGLLGLFLFASVMLMLGEIASGDIRLLLKAVLLLTSLPIGLCTGFVAGLLIGGVDVEGPYAVVIMTPFALLTFIGSAIFILVRF
jgi:cytochrome bd-type quinol oxidase subunit 2